MPRFIELSHPIHSGMVTYPGLPTPQITAWMDHQGSRGKYAQGTQFHIGQISMAANTGTYLDAPFHRYPDQPDVAGITLEQVAGLNGVLIDVRNRGRRIEADVLEGIALNNCAVLFLTGWDRHFGSARYAQGHPHLSAACADALIAGGASLVGIDSLNIDDDSDGERPVHTRLLGNDILIVEHLRGLHQLLGKQFQFSAVPLAVKGLGSFPVRAFAELN